MLLAGLGFGLLSARYMMENMSMAVPVGSGKWTEIKPDSDDLNGLYLSGHFLRRGEVPPLKGSRFFVRQVDDEGNTLRGDCVVAIEGKTPDARWWFVSADARGTRKALDAGEVVREASGNFTISISDNPVSSTRGRPQVAPAGRASRARSRVAVRSPPWGRRCTL